MSWLLNTILTFILESVQNWYTAQSAESARSEAAALRGKIQGVERVRKIETEIRDVVVEVPASPSDWNAGK